MTDLYNDALRMINFYNTVPLRMINIYNSAIRMIDFYNSALRMVYFITVPKNDRFV